MQKLIFLVFLSLLVFGEKDEESSLIVVDKHKQSPRLQKMQLKRSLRHSFDALFSSKRKVPNASDPLHNRWSLIFVKERRSFWAIHAVEFKQREEEKWRESSYASYPSCIVYFLTFLFAQTIFCSTSCIVVLIPNIVNSTYICSINQEIN